MWRAVHFQKLFRSPRGVTWNKMADDDPSKIWVNTNQAFTSPETSFEVSFGDDVQSPQHVFLNRNSRTDSTGSLHISHSSASSAQNSDEDEEDLEGQPLTYKQRRRQAHTQSEQKRRDAIKKGYDDLQELVPTLQSSPSNSSQKLSKAHVLQKSIDYIQFLVDQRKKQEDELSSLRKEVTALKIMQENIDKIVKAHKSSPLAGQNQVSDNVKFQVFQTIMDQLFQSFNNSISVLSFEALSGTVFRWLEEYCHPQRLRELVLDVLRRVNTQIGSRRQVFSS